MAEKKKWWSLPFTQQAEPRQAKPQVEPKQTKSQQAKPRQVETQRVETPRVEAQRAEHPKTAPGKPKILTAEGWRRMMLSRQTKLPKDKS